MSPLQIPVETLPGDTKPHVRGHLLSPKPRQPDKFRSEKVPLKCLQHEEPDIPVAGDAEEPEAGPSWVIPEQGYEADVITPLTLAFCGQTL